MDLDKKHYAWCKSEQELISYNKLQTETLYGKWWIGIKNDCMLQVKKWKPNENKVLTTAAIELLDHNSSIYVFEVKEITAKMWLWESGFFINAESFVDEA